MNSAKLFRVSKDMFSYVQKWKNENGSRRVFYLNRIFVITSGFYRIRTPEPPLQRPIANPLDHGFESRPGKKSSDIFIQHDQNIHKY